MADLVVVKLAEVFHIQFDLVDVGHRHKAVELHGQRLGHALDGAGDVGQFADARRLDEDAVGVVGLDDLLERLAEIAHERAADAAGVELVDLDAGLAHKAAVDADLAKFVLDEDDALPGEAFLDQLFDQRGLARAQKAGKNIDLGLVFCHDGTSVSFAVVFALAVAHRGCQYHYSKRVKGQTPRRAAVFLNFLQIFGGAQPAIPRQVCGADS